MTIGNVPISNIPASGGTASPVAMVPQWPIHSHRTPSPLTIPQALGNKAHNQQGWCSIFNDLSCHKSITQKHPEESCDSACMNARKDNKCGGALLE